MLQPMRAPIPLDDVGVHEPHEGAEHGTKNPGGLKNPGGPKNPGGAKNPGGEKKPGGLKKTGGEKAPTV